jgi:lipopolysaccharide transport system permease protein
MAAGLAHDATVNAADDRSVHCVAIRNVRGACEETMAEYLKVIWRFRYFIFASIRAELQGRFIRSRLGALWFILNPLAQGAIFAFVLSEVLGARLGVSGSKSAYAVYVLSGTAAWSLFSDIVNRSSNVFIEFAGQMKKIAFPRICLPVIVWGSAVINHLFLLFAICLLILLMGYVPTVNWFSIPVGIVLLSLLGIGFGLLLGVFNVFARDISQVLIVVMQIWFWLTPVIYPVNALPPAFRWVVDFNPVAPMIALYQNALLDLPLPSLGHVLPIAVLTGCCLALSFYVFRKASPEMVDVL